MGNRLRYYQIEVIVMARDEVLNQINHVTYHLEDAWPERWRTQPTSDRNSRFKLKELANGTSIIRADIELKDGGVLTLNRFIDLREEGPRL